MRLFVALELPEELLDALAETSAALRDCVRGRYVAPDSFHVTIAFLGEVEGSRVPALTEALSLACQSHAPIPVTLGELGCFGKRSSAILWQAVDGGEALSRLARDVRGSLRKAGFPFDEKAFVSHATLMRAADLSRGSLPMPTSAKGMAETVTLFSSDLSSTRPRYAPLERFALA